MSVPGLPQAPTAALAFKIIRNRRCRRPGRVRFRSDVRFCAGRFRLCPDGARNHRRRSASPEERPVSRVFFAVNVHLDQVVLVEKSRLWQSRNPVSDTRSKICLPRRAETAGKLPQHSTGISGRIAVTDADLAWIDELITPRSVEKRANVGHFPPTPERDFESGREISRAWAERRLIEFAGDLIVNRARSVALSCRQYPAAAGSKVIDPESAEDRHPANSLPAPR